jgi:hypothetical protein
MIGLFWIALHCIALHCIGWRFGFWHDLMWRLGLMMALIPPIHSVNSSQFGSIILITTFFDF